MKHGGGIKGLDDKTNSDCLLATGIKKGFLGTVPKTIYVFIMNR
jgi:hypothetical protein